MTSTATTRAARRAASTGILALALAGCSFDAGGIPPGSPGAPDASGDAQPGPPLPMPHLLLSEVNPRPNGQEFVEIFNPASAPVDLSNLYLSDSPSYALFPGARATGSTPALQTADFIVRFPAGAEIGPGAVAVVAMRDADFQSQIGVTPDYGVLQIDDPARSMVVEEVEGDPTITDQGEGVVLFYWDGESDLVVDVDMVTTGNAPTSGNVLGAKTGVAVDGPDADAAPSLYAFDANTIDDMDGDAASGQSYKRVLPETDAMLGVGNGLFGHDETSEDIRQTWDGPGAFSPPTPGVVPESLRNAQ